MYLCIGSHSGQTNDGYLCNGLMSTEPGAPIGTKMIFQMNRTSNSRTMMAALLDASPVKATFQIALSNSIVVEQLQFMVWGAISYHGRSSFLGIEDILNSNRYVREVLSFKTSLDLSFSRIMHAHMLQRLLESVQSNKSNFFLGLIICPICRL